jgi:hypothetical protein
MISRFSKIKNRGLQTMSILSVVAITALTACGGATSESAATSSTESSDNVSDSTVSAVASLFGSGATANVSANLTISSDVIKKLVDEAQDEEGQGYDGEEQDGEYREYDMCLEFADDSHPEPENVNTSAFGAAGTYGAEGNSITVTEADFCTMPDGTPNSGDDLVAAFEIADDVSASCTDAEDSVTTVTMQAGSMGVYRNTDEYFPQIYGSFVMVTDNDIETVVNCTIFLNEDGTTDFASCTDENGATVEQSDETSCDFSQEAQEE